MGAAKSLGVRGRFTAARAVLARATTAVAGALLCTSLVVALAPGGAGAGAAVRASSSGAQSLTDIASDNFWLASAQGAVWDFGSAGALGSVSGAAQPSGRRRHAHQGRTGLLARGLRRGHLLLRRRRLLRLDRRHRPQQADRRHGAHPRRQGLLARGLRRGHLLLRRRRLLRLDRAIALNKPIVGMAPTPDGKGYWLVASDGGIFSYGDAAFYGSTGAIHLAQPIVGMAPTPDGKGYWLVASDGGIFNFGDAGFSGSAAGAGSLDPAEKVVADHSGQGYWVEEQNGTAYGFGDAQGAPPTEGLLFQPVTPGDKAVLFAFAQLGKPYIWGGNGPVGYDCSGLALASWESGDGIGFARVSNDQYDTAGGPVAADQTSPQATSCSGGLADRLDDRVPHRHLRRREQDRRGHGRPGAAELARPVGPERPHAQRPAALMSAPTRGASGGAGVGQADVERRHQAQGGVARVDGLVEHLAQAVGQGSDVLLLRHGDDRLQLVLAGPANRVLGAQGVGEAAGRLEQHGVATSKPRSSSMRARLSRVTVMMTTSPPCRGWRTRAWLSRSCTTISLGSPVCGSVMTKAQALSFPPPRRPARDAPCSPLQASRGQTLCHGPPAAPSLSGSP